MMIKHTMDLTALAALMGPGADERKAGFFCWLLCDVAAGFDTIEVCTGQVWADLLKEALAMTDRPAPDDGSWWRSEVAARVAAAADVVL